MTDEQLKKYDNIPTEEIQSDLDVTKSEAESYETILKGLRMNPPEHRTRIYLDEGHLAKRYNLIEILEEILSYRKQSLKQL